MSNVGQVNDATSSQRCSFHKIYPHLDFLPQIHIKLSIIWKYRVFISPFHKDARLAPHRFPVKDRQFHRTAEDSIFMWIFL